ncbi:MAG: ATP-binding protein, partial [Flavobacteriaceae bacterium]|nr:ATP-binding protein [Flavobacteriaceae bacterium]
VRLFYSALDEVSIQFDEGSFKIIEYVNLGLHNQDKYFPLEKTIITFENNANYNLETSLLFEPPQYDKKILHHIYNANNAILEKLKKGITLHKDEERDIKNLPVTYLICYFNGFEEAIDKLNESKNYLKSYSEEIFSIYKESIRILRKVKYS